MRLIPGASDELRFQKAFWLRRSHLQLKCNDPSTLENLCIDPQADASVIPSVKLVHQVKTTKIERGSEGGYLGRPPHGHVSASAPASSTAEELVGDHIKTVDVESKLQIVRVFENWSVVSMF